MARKVELQDFRTKGELKLAHFTEGEAESVQRGEGGVSEHTSASTFDSQRIVFTSGKAQLGNSSRTAVRPA